MVLISIWPAFDHGVLAVVESSSVSQYTDGGANMQAVGHAALWRGRRWRRSWALPEFLAPLAPPMERRSWAPPEFLAPLTRATVTPLSGVTGVGMETRLTRWSPVHRSGPVTTQVAKPRAPDRNQDRAGGRFLFPQVRRSGPSPGRASAHRGRGTVAGVCRC